MDVILVWLTIVVLAALFLVVVGMVIDMFVNDDWEDHEEEE
jgi:hypothetical protein